MTKDESGAKEAPMGQSRGTENATLLRTRGPAGLPSSPLSKLTARFAKTAAPASATPLRSEGGGKYQYKNPKDVNSTKWPNNIQEVDANGDGQADYKITQTMVPDGTPGQYKVDVKVEKMPETMELVILMDNASAFAQKNVISLGVRAGDKIDRIQWAGIVGGTIEPYPTMYDWVDYYFRGVKDNGGYTVQDGRLTELLKKIKTKYPHAKVTLLGAGGRNLNEPYPFNNPYTSADINDAINYNLNMHPTVEANRNDPRPRWDFTGFFGRAGLSQAMQEAYDVLNGSEAKKKVFFHLQGFPTVSQKYLWWWDEGRPTDARRTFAKIQKIANVDWLVELDPSDYDNYFIQSKDYKANGLPDPSKIHFLQKTKKYWFDKDQYWNQVDKSAMETAYDNAIDAIAKNITSGSGNSDTLDLRIRLADNVLWRDPADDTMSKVGVAYDKATGSLTKSNFTMTSDKPLEFSYYVKANSQASTAKFNVFENINDAKTTGLKVSWKNPDGTKADKTSAMPIPQLRIPGWETTVEKYWYGNTATDDTSFKNFPETGTNKPNAPANALAKSKRKPSQVLVYSDTAYSDDQETKIGVGQRMESPYESSLFKKRLPYYDNNGKRIDYKATEYHDALFKTKTNLIQDESSLKQTFFIGAQMEPEDIRTDVEATIQWGAGTKPEDQVPVKVKLLAYRLNGDGAQEPIEGDELQTLVGEGKPTELTVGGSSWKGSFTDLPTSQIDKTTGEAAEIVYRVKEEPLSGFDVSYLYDYVEKEQADGSKKPTHHYTIVNQKHELLKVSNAPNEVDFYKVDGDGKPLAGAKFTLQKKHVDGEQVTWVDVDDWIDISSVTVKETVENEEVQREKIHFEKLLPGDYRLMETTAPEGYEVPKDPVATFTVSEETGKVEDIRVLGKDGKLDDGKSGSSIYNLPPTPVAFYMDKWGTQAEGGDKRVESGKLMMKLASKSDPSKFKTFTFDLSKDYKAIPGTNKTGLEIVIPADWPEGDYELTETMAPVGYRKLDAPIRLRYTKPTDPNSSTGRKVEQIDANGEVLATLYEEEKIDDVWTPTYGESVVPLKIIDEHSVFPYTAGPGTVLFAVAGAFLMTMAIALGGLTRKREKL